MACVGEVAFDGTHGDLELFGDDPLWGTAFDGRDDALSEVDGVGAHAGPPSLEHQHTPVKL